MKTVLTIAGSDSIGGAGIQADIKTISALDCYAMSAVTALTAQNTVGVDGVLEISGDFVKAQMKSVFSDVFPDAVKIGMMGNESIVKAVSEVLSDYKAVNVVTDPVMVSTSGRPLLSEAGKNVLIKQLFPLSDLITPNIPEAEAITGIKITSRNDMENAAEVLFDMCRGSVLLKGGHMSGSAADLLFDGDMFTWFESERIKSSNTHGTGCTLSSAVAVFLAYGLSLKQSVSKAKKYISGAISHGLDLGHGNGPLNHFYKNKKGVINEL